MPIIAYDIGYMTLVKFALFYFFFKGWET